MIASFSKKVSEKKSGLAVAGMGKLCAFSSFSFLKNCQQSYNGCQAMLAFMLSDASLIKKMGNQHTISIQ